MKWKQNNNVNCVWLTPIPLSKCVDIMLNEKEASTIGKCYAQVKLGSNFIRNCA